MQALHIRPVLKVLSCARHHQLSTWRGRYKRAPYTPCIEYYDTRQLAPAQHSARQSRALARAHRRAIRVCFGSVLGGAWPCRQAQKQSSSSTLAFMPRAHKSAMYLRRRITDTLPILGPVECDSSAQDVVLLWTPSANSRFPGGPSSAAARAQVSLRLRDSERSSVVSADSESGVCHTGAAGLCLDTLFPRTTSSTTRQNAQAQASAQHTEFKQWRIDGYSASCGGTREAVCLPKHGRQCSGSGSSRPLLTLLILPACHVPKDELPAEKQSV